MTVLLAFSDSTQRYIWLPRGPPSPSTRSWLSRPANSASTSRRPRAKGSQTRSVSLWRDRIELPTELVPNAPTAHGRRPRHGVKREARGAVAGRGRSKEASGARVDAFGGHRRSPTGDVAEVTTSIRGLAAEVEVDGASVGLERASVINCDGIHTIAQTSLTRRVGQVGDDVMRRVCSAVSYAIGC